MDKAKAAVDNFLHKKGHNDTTVSETIAPAVTEETIKKHRHDEATTAVDREVHQDHYHTTVQPVQDRVVEPEQHSHNVVPVEHREHHHGKDEALKASLEKERLGFHDTRIEGKTTHTQSANPVIGGEHTHHHVHENIQPVVQKETIQPSVVHTTIPIHEVHHNDPQHHAASALPAVSMNEFKSRGGDLSGREERYDTFEGTPKNIGSTGSSGMHQLGSNQTTAGPHSSNLGNKVDPRVDSDLDGSKTMGGNTTGTQSTLGSNQTTAGHHGSSMGNKMDPRIDSDLDGSKTVGGTTHGTTTAGSSGYPTTGTTAGTTAGTAGMGTAAPKKPSLLDRLNPKKDTDGDGKTGIMD